MPGIESFIQDSQKLTTAFSAWPSFHDAKVVDLHFWCGDVRAGDWDDRNIFPVLTAKIRVLAASQPGARQAGHDIFTTLRFHDVDDVKMERFNHMNAISGLSISTQDRGNRPSGESLPPYFVVQFKPGSGVAISFRCFRIEVVDVIPCHDV